MKRGECQLCLTETDLCHSHVIPKRYFTKILENEDEKKIKVLSTDTHSIQKPYQDGFKYYLFCKECELRLNRYETPYFNFIARFGDLQIDGWACLLGKSLKSDPEHYRTMKLYLLSIIWRMSIVKNLTFLDISLGKYEDEIRKMLLYGDPKNYKTLPIMLTKLKDHEIKGMPVDGDGYNRILITPYHIKLFGMNAYNINMDLFQYIVVVDKRPIDPIYENIMIKETGEIPVAKTNRHIIQDLEPFFGIS